jgi:flagellar hook-associated protein 2
MSTSGLNLNSLGLNSSTASSGSGIDVTSVVAQILDAERAPERLLQQQQATLTTQSSVLTGINSALNALNDKINALKDFSGALDGMNASSSNNAILTASAQSSAAAGSHVIDVQNLATTSSYYTAPLQSSSTAFEAGTISLQIGSGSSSTTVDIPVDSTNNTLDGLASYINGQNLGVSASVIQDANGARLALVSKVTGLAGDLTVTANTTDLALTKSSTGRNASLTIDGVPISSAGNTVTGALAGVTLNLASAPQGAEVILTVGPDTNSATQAISDFVAAYNSVTTAINGQFAFNTATNTAGPLAGDSSLRFLQSSLLSDVTYSITGNNGFVNLASIGVDMANDGTLTIDSTKLGDALANHFPDVQNLFQASSGATGLAFNFGTDLKSLTDSTQGILNLELSQNKNTQQALSNQIDDFEARMAVRQQVLTMQYSQVDTMLREFPLIMAQITGQLASLPTISSK